MKKAVFTLLVIVIFAALIWLRPAPRDVDGVYLTHPTPTVTSRPDEHPTAKLVRDLTHIPTQPVYGGWHMMTATPDGKPTPTLMFSYP